MSQSLFWERLTILRDDARAGAGPLRLLSDVLGLALSKASTSRGRQAPWVPTSETSAIRVSTSRHTATTAQSSYTSYPAKKLLTVACRALQPTPLTDELHTCGPHKIVVRYYML